MALAPGKAGDSSTGLADELIAIVRASTWLMPALRSVRSLGLESWCIGAGAIRNVVWDALHGFEKPSALSDIDVAYFDPSDLCDRQDADLEAKLRDMQPELPWEVTNQAAVHLWFEGYFGTAVEPLNSLEEAVGTWPEYATSVGVTLAGNDSLQVIAPHGLDDLFSITIRRNPTRASVENYRDRIARKRYHQRWPKVSIVPA